MYGCRKVHRGGSAEQLGIECQRRDVGCQRVIGPKHVRCGEQSNARERLGTGSGVDGDLEPAYRVRKDRAGQRQHRTDGRLPETARRDIDQLGLLTRDRPDGATTRLGVQDSEPKGDRARINRNTSRIGEPAQYGQ